MYSSISMNVCVCVCVCVTDLSHVSQFLQGWGGCGWGRVALLHQVREVTMVTVIPEPITLGVAASPPLLCLRVRVKREKSWETKDSGDIMLRGEFRTKEDKVAIKKHNELSLIAEYKQKHYFDCFQSLLSRTMWLVCAHSSPLSSLKCRPWSYYRHLPESPLSALHTTHYCSALLACNTHTQNTHKTQDPIIYKAILPKLYWQAAGMALIPKTCISQHKWILTSPAWKKTERERERGKQKQRGQLTWCGGCR